MAGRMPRRVDSEPAAHTDDDEMEMGDLVIDVKAEPPPWPLQAAGLQRRSPKEVPAPGCLEGAPRSCPTLVPAAARTLLALGLQNQPAPWTAPVPHPRGPSPGPDSELEDPKALTCSRCRRQFTARELLRHVQWDHGLPIYRTESEAPETPLLGLAEVAAAMPAVAGQELEAEGSRANSLPGQSPTCPVCTETLSAFSNLKVHTGERPYACDQCPFACAQSSKLNRHKKMHQRLQPQSPDTAKAPRKQASAAPPAPAGTLLCSCEGAGAADTAGAQEPGAPGGGGSGWSWWGRLRRRHQGRENPLCRDPREAA